MGMKPAAPERSRVLELGCGDGGNLVPMAAALPGSEFVGLDLAPGAVANARASASALGVGNVGFMEGDLAAVDASTLGRFDYVIAHGVYSWVPRPAADGLLGLCRAVLDTHGVAYVSYNALPGGHLRALAWDAMRYHATGRERPADRLAAAREMLGALAGGVEGDDDPYQRFSAAYAKRVSGRSDAVLYHDDLEHENTPVLFTDFVDHAAAHRLQYLAEADWFEMTPGRLSPAAADLLAHAGADRIVREQYLDFLRCRVYRQTLLCRADVRLTDEPSVKAVRSLLAAAPVRATSPHAQATGRSKVEFRTSAGATLATDHPLLKASLMVLGDACPERLPFARVLELATERIGPVADTRGEDALADLWLRGYAANVIHLHAHAPPHTGEPGERPCASDLVRRQVALGHETVTSLGHEAVELDQRTRALVELADGTRDRDALARELGSKRGLTENLDRLAALGILARDERA